MFNLQATKRKITIYRCIDFVYSLLCIQSDTYLCKLVADCSGERPDSELTLRSDISHNYENY